MTDKLVPAKRTIVTKEQYAGAAIKEWSATGSSSTPPKEALAVLWAQFAIETGGRHVWNYNLGNSKEVDGDGIDFHTLKGTWEGVTREQADRLVRDGLATLDTNASHIKAVAPRVAVVFEPPHPATRFSAFSSLEEGMRYHLRLLATKRYASCWPLVLAGDYKGFARALKARGYFTASAEAYAAGMAPAYRDFLASDAYEARTDKDDRPKGLQGGDFPIVECGGEKWLVCPVYIAPIGIGQAADLAASLGFELPSRELVDAIWKAADMRIDPWGVVGAAGKHDGTPRTMDAPETHARVAAYIERVIDKPYRLLAGAFKDVVMVGDKLALYGWHDMRGKPVQGVFTGHARAWRDYSQGVRLVKRAV